jgi:hypothetical protein
MCVISRDAAVNDSELTRIDDVNVDSALSPRSFDSPSSQHTSIIFFKRFYLYESVMEYSPKDVASVGGS